MTQKIHISPQYGNILSDGNTEHHTSKKTNKVGRNLSLSTKKDPFFYIFQQDLDDFQTTKTLYNRKKLLPTKLPKILETNSKVKYAQEILEEKEVFAKNEILRQNIAKLKAMNLIQDKSLKIKSFKSTGKSDFVMNDFHLRATNPGFSRNNLGSFFTK